MELVIDTNIVFSAIVRNSAARLLLLNSRLILYSPEGLMSELEDDSPFMALALAKRIPLWSNDKPLKEKQSFVRVLSTSELYEIMK